MILVSEHKKREQLLSVKFIVAFHPLCVFGFCGTQPSDKNLFMSAFAVTTLYLSKSLLYNQID